MNKTVYTATTNTRRPHIYEHKVIQSQGRIDNKQSKTITVDGSSNSAILS